MTKIDCKEVAKYYIECELDNISNGSIKLHNNPPDWPRLLEALSFTFRANGVFDFIMNPQNIWEKREVDANKIRLTGMGEGLTEIIYNPKIDRNPKRLAELIQKNPTDTRFANFKTRDVPENRQTIILRRSGDEMWLLDGSHRLLSMLMRGKSRFTAFIVTPTKSNTKPFVGDAVFLRLREFWRNSTNTNFKESIEKTIAGMVSESDNGYNSVKRYWIDDAPNEEVVKAGKRILATV
ncbi:MAG: hypothetical protein ACOX0Z_02445 [Candidatus Nanosyncoccaceae bacterium]|jgi:hypothetical protein